MAPESGAPDWLAFCRFTIPVLNLAGAWIRCLGQNTHANVKSAVSGVTSTAVHTTVTMADLLGQETILRSVLDHYPNLVPLAEEDTYHNQIDRTEIDEAAQFLTLDPLDGTLAFTQASNGYCTMLGIFDVEEFLLGIIHFPALEETYVGIAGAGAFSVDYGTRSDQNPWQLENFHLRPLHPAPCREKRTLAAHYRFLLDPYDGLARVLADDGFSFKTLQGAPVEEDLDGERLGSNGALLRDLLQGGSAAYIGPFVALHDIAALVAIIKSLGGAVKFFDTASDRSKRWVPLEERRVIDGILHRQQIRCRVIMALEKQVIEDIEKALWGDLDVCDP